MNPPADHKPPFNIQDLTHAVRADPGLTPEEREEVLDRLSEPTFSQKLLYGGFGAAVSGLLARYLGLSKKTQVVLVIAGFGLGQMLLHLTRSDKNKSMQYNEHTKLYEYTIK